MFNSIPAAGSKNFTQHALIDLIRFTPGGISRSELARQLGLSRAAISSVVIAMQRKGLIGEVEEGKHGGRKPIVLKINPELGFVIGIDMGASHVTLILADFSTKTLQEMHMPIDIQLGPRICLGQVDTYLNEMLGNAGLLMSQVKAVGVGIPGPVLAELGVVSSSPTLPTWDGFPIRDMLQTMWKCPVSVNNDAELGVLGEWACGAGRGEKDVVYIKVGVGIGAGLLLDGQIYRGQTGCAGEIGHVVLVKNGPLCHCGNHGCLEALAGGWAIVQQARAAVQNGRQTSLREKQPLDALLPQDVVLAAGQGDEVAQKIVAEAGVSIGLAAAGLVNVVNPGMVIIGGSMVQNGDLLLEPIRREVQQRSLRAASRAVRIVPALLGRRSSGMGAVTRAISLAIHRLVDQ